MTRFETQFPALARVDEDAPIAGRTVESVEPSGKWVLMNFSGDLVLLTHMLMSGSWHIYRPGEAWQRARQQMRVAVYTAAFVAVAFQIQIAEFHTSASLRRHRSVSKLGPDVLGEEFDPHAAAVRLGTQPELEVGPALLTQSILAGLGNVYKSEVCFAARVNPFRTIGSLTPAELTSLVTFARKFMLANTGVNSEDRIVTYTGFRRTTGRADPWQGLWVYGRRGEPCRRCGTALLSRKQGIDARTTFWCPECQPVTYGPARA